MSKLSQRSILLISAVFLSLLISVMLPFYDHAFLAFLSKLGVNLIVIVFAIVLLVNLLQYFIQGKFHNKWSWLLLAPIFAITYGLAFYSFNNLSILFFPLLILLLFIYAFWAGVSLHLKTAMRQIFNRDFSDYIDAFFKKIFGVFDTIFSPKQNEQKSSEDKIQKDKNFKISPTLWKVIIGLIVAFPLFIIFAALFSSADAVFSNLMETVFDFVYDVVHAILDLFAIENLWTLILWTLRFSVLALVLYSFLRVYLGPRVFPKKEKEQYQNLHSLKPVQENIKKNDDHVIGITILVVLNLLFITFIGVQLFVLFAGHGIIEKLSITYSEYVHKGFNQLAMATGLVLGISLLMQLTDRGKKSKWLRYLNVILLGQTIVIAASALKRILLYIDAYGLSRLRFTVEHFIIFTFIILILMIITLARKKRLLHFMSYSFIIAVLYLSFISAFNIEAHIAQTNINRYLQGEGRDLDISYLSRFNTDITEQMNILEGMYNDAVDNGRCDDMVEVDVDALRLEIDGFQEKIDTNYYFIDTSRGVHEVPEYIAFIEATDKYNDLKSELGHWTDKVFQDNEELLLELEKVNPVHWKKMSEAWDDLKKKTDSYYNWIDETGSEIEAYQAEISKLEGYIESGEMPMENMDKDAICRWDSYINEWKDNNVNKIRYKLDIVSSVDLTKDRFMDNKRHWVNLTVSDIKFVNDYLEK